MTQTVDSNMRTIKIGCDPAFRKDGFCICIVDEYKEVGFITFKKYIDFIGWVQNDMPENSKVAIENSYLQKSTFDMRGSKPEVARKSRNVGMNQAASEIAYQLFRQYSKYVRNISPKEKGAKWVNDSTVLRVAKSMGLILPKTKFSQDERDAFKLVTFL